MNIFANSDSIISEVINRVLNCRQLTHVYTWGNIKSELDYLYSAVKTEKWSESAEGDVVYLRVESLEEYSQVKRWICSYRKKKDFVIYIPKESDFLIEKMGQYGTPYPLNEISALDGYLFLIGQTFDRKDEWIPDEQFKALAILHFYNEADILEKTIEYLLGQDVDVYLLDNWSDDGSYEIASNYKEKYPDKIFLEHFPQEGKTGEFELYKQMEVTEKISKELDYNWYIHYDADEIRVSPWENVNFRQALYWIDRLGYNCVENTVIDFKLTELNQENIFMKDTYFEFRHKYAWFNHLKTWKKTDDIDLKSTAGHTLKIRNPKVFSLKFLNKHYPLRTQVQAEIKIFKERIPRFAKEKDTYGWHGHYDKYLADAGILVDKSDLLLWQKETFNKLYLSLFMECGLRWDEDTLQVNVPDLQDKKLVIYGAGKVGQKLIQRLSINNEILGWIDKKGEYIPWMYCKEVDSLERMIYDFDYIVIGIKQVHIQNQVMKDLIDMGIDFKRVIVA
ncbi:MAG: glycosyltransferase family 2 protein [Agathobacter sp.]|nr:glycosyltransferase family 2 protein [Agathobacter sp.]